jgi:diguanylate cyclase (GGDEF)-like protein
LCTALGEPYTLCVNGHPLEVRIGASIGISPYVPDDRPDADEQLIQAADRAMYEAKRGGKNRCVLTA